jgi:hypothetical protein
MPKQIKLTPNEISNTLPKLSLIKPFKFGDIIIHPALTSLCCTAFDLSGIESYSAEIILHCNIASLANIC